MILLICISLYPNPICISLFYILTRLYIITNYTILSPGILNNFDSVHVLYHEKGSVSASPATSLHLSGDVAIPILR